MNKFSVYGRLFLLFFLALPSILWSQTPPLDPSGNTLSVKPAASPIVPPASIALPEVVTTADRLQTPVSQVANSLTVITAKDMERKQTTTVLEALQGVPALNTAKNGGPGENSSIFIRGANPEHTLVLLDGIPLNDPISTSRSFDDLDQISVEDVKQIEVVRGPESPIYGSSAMGGVVNIITQQGKGRPKGSFLFEGGAYGTFRETAAAGGGGTDNDFFFTASHFDTVGFPSADKTFGNVINNGHQNTTASLRLGSSPFSNLKNDVLVRYVQSRTSLDQGGGPKADDPNYFVDGRKVLVNGRSSLKLLNGAWEQDLGISYADQFRKYTNDPSVYQPFAYQRSIFDGQVIQLDWQNNIHPFLGETLVAGLQEQQEWGLTNTDYGFGLTTQNSTATTGGYFLESQTNIDDRLFATIGGRLDAHSQFGFQWTYRGAAAYFLPDLETKLKATYGTGFRAPSLYQLYSTYGSASLLPEASVGWDAGVEQPIFGKDLMVGVTYFRNSFTNLIDFNNTTSKYFNVNRTQTDGWEAFVSARPIKDLECQMDYTYTNAQDIGTGKALLRRPQDKADFNAFYQWGQAGFGLSVIYVGNRPDLSFPPPTFIATPVTLNSYTLLNLMISYQVDANIKLFSRVNNLFNVAYEEVYGYGTPGLSIFAGTKVSL